MTSPADIKGLVEDDLEWLHSHLTLWRRQPPQPMSFDRLAPERVAHEARIDRILQALASISEGAQQPVDMRKVVEALGFEPDNHHNAVKCPYCNPHGWNAPATQAEREAVEQLIARHLQYIANPSAVAKPLADAIISLLESRRTTPDPHPLTALLTRWDNGESVGDLITQYLRGGGDWGPVRVLVGATTRSPSTLPDGWRERVARIVDPYAFGPREDDLCDAHDQSIAKDRALSKADAIGEVFATGGRPNPDSPTPSEKKP